MGVLKVYDGSVWQQAAVAAGGGGDDYELAHVEDTDGITVTASTDASADTALTLPAFSVDGSTEVIVEVMVPSANVSGGNRIWISLWEGSTDLGRMVTRYDGNSYQGIFATYRFTPSSGSHTYLIKARVDSGTGTLTGGAGGAGTYLPAYARVYLANPTFNVGGVGGASTADDVSVADAGNYYPVEGTVVELRPDAITASSGATGAVTTIDEAVLDTGDYIWLNNPNNYVTYSFGDCAGVVPEGATITRVRHVAYTGGQSGSNYRFRLEHSSGSSAYEDIDRDASGYAYGTWFDSTWWDASAWDTTKVDGVSGRFTSDGYPDVYIYQAYLEVEYTTAGKTVEKALTSIGPSYAKTGTAFPDSPATGQRYRRSDLDYQMFFYDGTRWLSEQMFTLQMVSKDTSWSSGDTAYLRYPLPADLDIYAVKADFMFRDDGSTADVDASISVFDHENDATTLVTRNYAAAGDSNWRHYTDSIGTLVECAGSNAANEPIYVSPTVAVTSGAAHIGITLYYRLVAV
jgi:hypothetical protein